MNGSDGAPASGGGDRPVIGLTTYRQRAHSGVWDTEASFLQAGYLNGVTRAGGIAVLLPPQPVDPGIVAAVLKRLDGLILTGGADIDPARYGQDPHRETGAPAPERDAWEFALLHGALGRGMPVLGICRGAQVLNVALGGTLHQHIPDIDGRNHQPGEAVFAASSVTTVAGSRLAGLIGASARAHCYHHQAIDRLGDGVVVSAVDEDGIVEAVEIPGEQFALAVQWHPEEAGDDLRIFGGLVQAAGAFTKEKVR